MSTCFSVSGQASGVAKQRVCQMEGGPQPADGTRLIQIRRIGEAS